MSANRVGPQMLQFLRKPASFLGRKMIEYPIDQIVRRANQGQQYRFAVRGTNHSGQRIGVEIAKVGKRQSAAARPTDARICAQAPDREPPDC